MINILDLVPKEEIDKHLWNGMTAVIIFAVQMVGCINGYHLVKIHPVSGI